MRHVSYTLRFGLLLAAALAVGCGNKGDLVRPDSSTPAKAAEQPSG